MNYKQLIVGVLIGLVLGFLITRERPPETVVSTVTVTIPGDTVFKTIERTKEVLRDKVVYKEIVRIDTLEIDTLAILYDYYTKYAYLDVYNESECEVSISDTIYMNQIVSRLVAIKNNREKEIVTTEIKHIYPTDRMFHAGAIVGIGQTNTLIPSVAYQDRKNNLFMVGYDINNKMFNAGMLFRVSKK
jgi:hypothetical protein